MEEYFENTKLTSDQAQQLLADKGVIVSLQEAEEILKFLRKMGQFVVQNYLNKKD